MESDNSVGNIYHIGNNDEIDIGTLTTYIGELLGYAGNYQAAITYPGSVGRCPDDKKAKGDLDYVPKVGWREAVELTAIGTERILKQGIDLRQAEFEAPESVMAKMTK